MQKKKLIILVLIVILTISACNSSPSPQTNDESTRLTETTKFPPTSTEILQMPTLIDRPVYTGMNLSELGAYASTLEIRMQGNFDWSYRLSTRFDGTQTEYSLQIEGVDTSIDPGDVRLVTDDTTSRMLVTSGETTTCSQFPANYYDSPSFLTPVNLLSPVAAADALIYTGAGEMLDRKISQYAANNASVGKWPNATMQLWIDDQTEALMRFEISATREDPLFDAGSGRMTAVFEINEIAAQVIEPVSGCEMTYPVIKDASEYVYLSGIVAYQTMMTLKEAKQFYINEMTASGWQAGSDQSVTPASGVDVLEFHKDDLTFTVNLESGSSGTSITLYLP